MRISIWQQFSSNHSGSITIVGSFESPEKASEATATVDGVIKELIEWYERPENADLAVQPWDASPTPIEEELIRKYGLKADRHFNIGRDVRCSISVTAADRVTVINIGEVRDEPPSLLKSLLEQLGSQNVATQLNAEGEFITAILVSLTCSAPDAVTAESIHQAVQKHLQSDTEMPPWSDDEDTTAYGSVLRDGTRLAFDVYFYEIQHGLPALISYLEARACQDITYTPREIEIYGLAAQAILGKIAQEHIDRLSRYNIKVDVSCLAPNKDMAKRILNFVRTSDAEVVNFQIGSREQLTPGQVTRDGMSLVFRDLALSGYGYEVDKHLHAIVALLSSLGCEDFVVEIIHVQSGEQS